MEKIEDDFELLYDQYIVSLIKSKMNEKIKRKDRLLLSITNNCLKAQCTRGSN